MADDARLSCGRSIDDVWSHLDGPPDEHERTCPYCLEARARLLRLSDAAIDLRSTEAADPALQPDPGFTASVMGLVRAEVRRGQAIPLDADEVPGLTISEQAVVGLVWAAADSVPGIRARRCRVRPFTDDDGDGDGDGGEDGWQPPDEHELRSGTLVDVDLALAVEPGTSIVEATATLRRRVAEQVARETGLGVRRVDLTVEDVL
ncbi:Asp23/Gls24 family envelope stress response protein [Microlunatus flavus]|uniref:Uncharacterized conserved protein YloU, alkaline shock protein (Asp23) family n=1 Tax=Microlunatus flavus TaxID=1036181 RepID=A0A1H9F159_9ACTN|nr:Asp23/Gls24 family envelope stress response protein [Microlunatus flavus]SEQ31599.1 Uncharacterized conserved protein YloU, alkaline shock protein (Asp23) family [Microlunatus flavus]